MSSPLSMLGKNKRVPFPGPQNQGRRGLPSKEKLDKCHEATMPDDSISPGLRQPAPPASDAPSTSRLKVTQRKSNSNGAGLSDFELMTTMMQKLTQLERKVNAQSLDIQRKEKKIALLEEKLRILQKSQEKTSSSSQVEELEQTCVRLQNQVWEMESFLNDYGMVWVGSSEGQDTPSPQEEREGEQEVHHGRRLWQPGATVVRDFQMNFDLVLQSIRDLNIVAGEGVSHVEATPGGARLARQSPVPLTLFSNGIVMFGGPFRSYQDPSTQQCMQDLMDGYFPSELQKKFPDGVPFQVSDRREEVFKERRVGAEFPGEGKAVGQATEHSPDNVGHAPDNTLSVEQFLNKLPKVVIKAGKVIDVRDSVKATMRGSGSSSDNHTGALIDTPALQDMKKRLEARGSPRTPSPSDVTMLRVRSEDGEQTYLLKMRLSETIGHLRQYLDKHRGEGLVPYDIISTFLPRCYDDDSLTLATCGLTSKATLLLRAKPKPH
ncbi:UBX domain-containing protein 11 [Megalops cyprinoides]|uniref:UBX domain-containing protein 11 n=1 Tax=Megalops cyprinoides TaxID=118141 RepID=UPI0018654395|nr:UBX domain-containing protein 11 [Megalops cyprinoides]